MGHAMSWYITDGLRALSRTLPGKCRTSRARECLTRSAGNSGTTGGLGGQDRVAARDAGQEGYFSCRAAVRSMRPEGSPSSLGREKMKEARLLAARMLPKGFFLAWICIRGCSQCGLGPSSTICSISYSSSSSSSGASSELKLSELGGPSLLWLLRRLCVYLRNVT